MSSSGCGERWGSRRRRRLGVVRVVGVLCQPADAAIVGEVYGGVGETGGVEGQPVHMAGQNVVGSDARPVAGGVRHFRGEDTIQHIVEFGVVGDFGQARVGFQAGVLEQFRDGGSAAVDIAGRAVGGHAVAGFCCLRAQVLLVVISWLGIIYLSVWD